MSYSKYKAQKTVIDGHTFDSKREANRYCELRFMLQAKLIKDLELQPRFELQPSFRKNGKTYRKIEYVADFKYFDNQKQKFVVEDVKGMLTDVFKLKRKMFEYRYPDLELIEVR